MTPVRVLRPVLLGAAGLLLNACGLDASETARFETLAQKVADIEVPLDPSRDAPAPTQVARADGMRPALPASKLRVEVMDPHDLWDAREAGLRGAIVQAAPRVVEAAAPAVAEAVVRRAGDAVRRTTIQLGAYSTPEGAQKAWADVKSGAGRRALNGLSPVFETVQVNGREFTRLKVGPIPVDAAATLCRAVEVTDPWCRRGA